MACTFRGAELGARTELEAKIWPRLHLSSGETGSALDKRLGFRTVHLGPSPKGREANSAKGGGKR